jgi:hypothetical protein
VDAAHEIFRKPFAVTPTLTKADTPANYRGWPEGAALPAQLDVWKVQEKLRARNFGLVSDGYGFTDSPDCEYISGGLNSKGPGAVALGRQANWFLWGFCASPQEMTEEARRVFLNTVVYMKRFDGARPLFPKARGAREWALLYANYIEGENAKWAREKIAPELIEAAGGVAEKLVALLRRDLGYVVSDGVFRVDADAQALGLANRDLVLMERCVALLEQGEGTERARRLLERYLPERLATAADYRAWLSEHRDRLYFTDTGGYGWRVRE